MRAKKESKRDREGESVRAGRHAGEGGGIFIGALGLFLFALLAPGLASFFASRSLHIFF